LDAGLNNDQKNVSHAMISMIENHLVWWVENTLSKTWYLFLLTAAVGLQKSVLVTS
jgi:hypothetical protein